MGFQESDITSRLERERDTQSPVLSFAVKCLKISGTCVWTKKPWCPHREYFYQGVVEFTCWLVMASWFLNRWDAGLACKGARTMSRLLRAGGSSPCGLHSSPGTCSLEATGSSRQKGWCKRHGKHWESQCSLCLGCSFFLSLFWQLFLAQRALSNVVNLSQ